MNLLLKLPHGGLAIVHVDEVANTARVVGHDHQTLSVPANDPHALHWLAQYAAADDRDEGTLREVYRLRDAPYTEPRPLDRLRIGEQVLDMWRDEVADGAANTLPNLRDFARGLWSESKGDHAWAEYWASCEAELLARALR